MPSTVSAATAMAVNRKVRQTASRKRGSASTRAKLRSQTTRSGFPEVRFQLVRLRNRV